MRILVLSLVSASWALASVEVRDACGEDSSVVATIQETDAIRVDHGVVGESTPCYAVTVNHAGVEVRGYILSNTAAAIVEFERRRALESRVPVPEPPPLSAADAKKAAEPPAGPPFEPWSGVDLKGKKFQIGSGKGVTLVTFWAVESAAGRRAAENLNGLRYMGADAFAFVRPVNLGVLNSELDDMGLSYPLAFDRQGLAAKYGADPNKGTTLVIDSSNHIVTSSSDPKELRAAVAKLLSSK